MKKTFLHFAMLFAASMMVFSACEPEEKPDDNGGLKDPTEQPGGNENENPGNENENPGGNENENPGGNQGGTTDGTASLQGSAYAPVYLDAVSLESVKTKVVADLTVDDVNRFLYVWEGTYIGVESAGLNFYDEAAGYLSLQVGTAGWSGAGFCITAPEQAGFCQLSEISDWYLHFAYKPTKDIAQLMTIIWANKEYKFAYGKDYVEYSSSGDGSIVATHKAVAPLSGTVTLNTWNEYEICLEDMGIDFSQPTTGNYLVLNTDPVTGNMVNLDAVFFYKK